MDMTVIRSLVTLAAFMTFIGIVAWAFSASRREHFEAAARVPLDEGEADERAGAAGDEGSTK